MQCDSERVDSDVKPNTHYGNMVANAELPPDDSGNNNSGGAHVQVKPAEESKVEVGGGYPVCPQV